MEIREFIQNFTDQLDETDTNTINADTIINDINEWSSLTALSVIAMCDDEYDVTLKGEDIKKAITIKDLFNIVKSKKQ